MSSCPPSSPALASQSAIERTPPEIIHYIFSLGSKSVSFGSSIPFPLLVSHVCGRWRDIALYSSGLWSTVVCTQSAPRFPILKLLLERSQNHPLDLYFYFKFPKGYVETYPHRLSGFSGSRPHCIDSEYESTSYLTDSEKISKRLSLLTTSRYPRIRSFFVASTNYSYISLSIRSIPRGPNPHLSSFEICYVPGHEEISRWGTVNVPVNRDGVASRLKRLRLRGVDLNWESTSTYLTGLTTLELGGHKSSTWMSYGRLQTILRSNSSLETLILDHSCPLRIAEEWPEDEVVELSNLTKLVLSKLRTEAAVALLARLKLPAVRWLEIVLPYRTDMAREREQGGTGMHDELVRMLVPLVNKLTVARMCEVHPSRKMARALLAAIPNLRVLVLDCDQEASDGRPYPSTRSPFLELLSHSTLSHSSHAPLFVPHLSHLVLPGHDVEKKEDHLDVTVECRPASFNVYAPVKTAMLDMEGMLHRIGYENGLVDG